MGVFKCKMCGGDLNVKPGEKVVECEFCGTTQTVSTSNDDKVLKLFARGNTLRSEGEFDKAYNVFEQIIAEDNADAEAYWNLLLCKYGITYVDDYDGKKKPTINRMSLTSILEDNDYKKTLELADVVAKDSYIEQANAISKIQNGIMEIVKNEKPYDIFISYKETDEFGDRTKDSILAQEIHDTLTKEGYRVFMSRISLSSVAGQEYEPYIYSAMYSSKMMILVTTNVDYTNSVWVKNEWTRFIAMMQKDTSKKLIPCYKDIDAYDLPKEVRNIQGLDMSKLGFIQDLVVGVNKVLSKKKEVIQNTTIIQNNVTNNNETILRRCEILLEDRDFDKARELCDEVLNSDPTCATAYAILLHCDLKMTINELLEKPVLLKNNKNFEKINRFGTDELKSIYNKINDSYFENEYIYICNYLNENVFDFDELDELKERAIKLESDYGSEYKDCRYKFDKIVELKEQMIKSSVFLYGANLISTKSNLYFYKNGVLLSKVDYSTVTELSVTNGLDGACSILVYWRNPNYHSELVFASFEEAKRQAEQIKEKISAFGNTQFKFRDNSSNIETQGKQDRKSKGCYIATCVYNSYDCPQVWRLRRYRDNYLDEHWWGKLFIKIYYAISPKLVKLFGNKKWFRNPIKKMLDRKVLKLEKKGYEDTPYNDKY